MSAYLVDLGEIRASDCAAAGHKAANLASLAHAGFPVPPGYCLTTRAFERALEPFRDRIDRRLRATRSSEPESAVEAARWTQRELEELELPHEVADGLGSALDRLGNVAVGVRSSATVEDLPGASFAGAYATVLGVCDVNALHAAVLTCWRSFFSAPAIAARTAAGLGHEGGMAVLVQQMIEAECSGVCYSVDPVEMRQDVVVICAAWGAGAGVVEGTVPSDTYRLRRLDLQSERQTIADKAYCMIVRDSAVLRVEVASDRRRSACLPEEWMRRVAEAGIMADQHFGMPQDVEWTIAEQRLWILQSRPLTGIPEEMRQIAGFPVRWQSPEAARRHWTLSWECRQRVPLPLEHDYGDVLISQSREDACRLLGEDRIVDSMFANGRRYLAKREGVVGAGDRRVKAQAHADLWTSCTSLELRHGGSPRLPLWFACRSPARRAC